MENREKILKAAFLLEEIRKMLDAMPPDFLLNERESRARLLLEADFTRQAIRLRRLKAVRLDDRV